MSMPAEPPALLRPVLPVAPGFVRVPAAASR